jgi:hypothetical protein
MIRMWNEDGVDGNKLQIEITCDGADCQESLRWTWTAGTMARDYATARHWSFPQRGRHVCRSCSGNARKPRQRELPVPCEAVDDLALAQ